MALTAIHPGEYLAEELETLDMNAAELARKIGVPTNRVTQILNGTRAITGDTAQRLAHFFGTKRSVLAESTEPLRAAAGPGEGREIHQVASHECRGLWHSFYFHLNVRAAFLPGPVEGIRNRW